LLKGTYLVRRDSLLLFLPLKKADKEAPLL